MCCFHINLTGILNPRNGFFLVFCFRKRGEHRRKKKRKERTFSFFILFILFKEIPTKKERRENKERRQKKKKKKMSAIMDVVTKELLIQKQFDGINWPISFSLLEKGDLFSAASGFFFLFLLFLFSFSFFSSFFFFFFFLFFFLWARVVFIFSLSKLPSFFFLFLFAAILGMVAIKTNLMYFLTEECRDALVSFLNRSPKKIKKDSKGRKEILLGL